MELLFKCHHIVYNDAFFYYYSFHSRNKPLVFLNLRVLSSAHPRDAIFYFTELFIFCSGEFVCLINPLNPDTMSK